jgi:8-oxo-dGTP diphosphatase
MNQQYPLMGTAVWIRRDGKIMLAKRALEKKAGAGMWCPPGGHVEMFETIEDCAIRETREEAGIEIQKVRLMTFLEDPYRKDGTHYVTFHFVADWKLGEPRPQPGESEEWHWFTWSELPQPLFKPAQDLLDAGINPLEYTA